MDAMQGAGEEEGDKTNQADFGGVLIDVVEEERKIKKLRRKSFIHGFVAAAAMGVIVFTLLNRGGRRLLGNNR